LWTSSYTFSPSLVCLAVAYPAACISVSKQHEYQVSQSKHSICHNQSQTVICLICSLIYTSLILLAFCVDVPLSSQSTINVDNTVVKAGGHNPIPWLLHVRLVSASSIKQTSQQRLQAAAPPTTSLQPMQQDLEVCLTAKMASIQSQYNVLVHPVGRLDSRKIHRGSWVVFSSNCTSQPSSVYCDVSAPSLTKCNQICQFFYSKWISLLDHRV